MATWKNILTEATTSATSLTSIGTLTTLSVDNITVNANTISSTDTNGNILLAANGTGKIEVRGNTNSGAVILNCENNSHGITIQAPAHSAFSGDYTLTLPADDGDSDQVLKTNGSGVLDWVDQTAQLTTEAVQDIVGAMFSSNTETRISATYQDGDGTIDLVVDDMTGGSGLTSVGADSSPQLGGDLDTNSNNILFAKTSNTDHDSNGDIVKIGTGSTTQGELCYYTSSGTWVAADADATGTAGGVLLAIALGTDPDVDGMLLRGMYTLDHDPGTIADELYVSTTAGDITGTAPSGTGDVVRVVGYCLDSTNGQIWFNPSNDFIVLA